MNSIKEPHIALVTVTPPSSHGNVAVVVVVVVKLPSISHSRLTGIIGRYLFLEKVYFIQVFIAC